jgi:hypothetical protein
MDSIYLPILAETSTQASPTELERLRRSIHAKGKLWGGWSDNTSTTLYSNSYTGGSTAWTAGGQIAPQVHIDAYGFGQTTGTLTFAHTVAAKTNKLLLVFVSSSSGISGVTWNGGAEALTQLETSSNGNAKADIWYLKNPTAATENIVVTGGGGVAAQSISLWNVDQSSTFGTDVEDTGAGTGDPPSLDVATTVGDLVVDVVAGEADITASTPGDGQVEVRDYDPSTADYFLSVTREYAQRTTTTMSETLAGGDEWAHVAVGVKAITSGGPVNILLDMATHKDQMIALYAEGDSHYAVRTSKADNTTDDWSLGNGAGITTGLLTDAVTSGEDIDAGLLASAGGELIAAVWHESNGTITFFSSTDAGTTWTDEAIDIGSGNGPQGLLVYPDIDGTDKLYLGTAEGIWLIDTSPSTWDFEFIHAMSFSTDNCRDMTIHQGAIWFAEGVDNNTAAPIYRMTVQGDSRAVESGFGLNYGDGVPEDLLGPVRRMKSSGDFLYISVGGGVEDRKSRVMCWNGKGWHSMTKHPTASAANAGSPDGYQVIEWIDVGTEDDATSRLHFSVKTGPVAATSKFLAHANTNPASGVSIKREVYSSENVGHIDLPYYDFGLPQEQKLFTRVHVIAADLNDTSNEFVELLYGLDDAARATDLGDFLSGNSSLDFGSSLGVSAKNIGLRLRLKKRGSSGVHTPKVRDVVVEGYVVPSVAYEHEMTVDIARTSQNTGQSNAAVITALEALVDSVPQFAMQFAGESRNVAVDRDRSGFNFTLEGFAPSALSERSGYFTLFLVEKLA